MVTISEKLKTGNKTKRLSSVNQSKKAIYHHHHHLHHYHHHHHHHHHHHIFGLFSKMIQRSEIGVWNFQHIFLWKFSLCDTLSINQVSSDLLDFSRHVKYVFNLRLYFVFKFLFIQIMTLETLGFILSQRLLKIQQCPAGKK